MLKPARMQRVAVVGTKDERPKVVSTLYDMGVIHIEPLSKEAAAVLKPEGDVGGSKEVSEELLRIRALKAALRKNPTERPRTSIDYAHSLSSAAGIPIADAAG